jgi:hypothetical protein
MASWQGQSQLSFSLAQQGAQPMPGGQRWQVQGLAAICSSRAWASFTALPRRYVAP